MSLRVHHDARDVEVHVGHTERVRHGDVDGDRGPGIEGHAGGGGRDGHRGGYAVGDVDLQRDIDAGQAARVRGPRRHDHLRARAGVFGDHGAQLERSWARGGLLHIDRPRQLASERGDACVVAGADLHGERAAGRHRAICRFEACDRHLGRRVRDDNDGDVALLAEVAVVVDRCHHQRGLAGRRGCQREGLLERRRVRQDLARGEIPGLERRGELGLDQGRLDGVGAPGGDAGVGPWRGASDGAGRDTQVRDVRAIVVEGVEEPRGAVGPRIVAGEVDDAGDLHRVPLARRPWGELGEHDDGVLLRERHQPGRLVAGGVGDHEGRRDVVGEPHRLVEDEPDGRVEEDLVFLGALRDEHRRDDVRRVEGRGQGQDQGPPHEVRGALAIDGARGPEDRAGHHDEVVAGVAQQRRRGRDDGVDSVGREHGRDVQAPLRADEIDALGRDGGGVHRLAEGDVDRCGGVDTLGVVRRGHGVDGRGHGVEHDVAEIDTAAEDLRAAVPGAVDEGRADDDVDGAERDLLEEEAAVPGAGGLSLLEGRAVDRREREHDVGAHVRLGAACIQWEQHAARDGGGLLYAEFDGDDVG